ncbi:MAG: RNA-binding protein [Deltaproteobacteria bacterium]|nr:RNA-binding protein [Deltaproteobacteria bacterium]
MKTIYVGNLPYSASAAQVENLFAEYGRVHSVNLITDRETGRQKGFGFVQMDPPDAEAAIEALNGREMGGRTLRVNEARERGSGGGRPPRRESRG